jgi:spore coat polysaccharide biosynthesis predicted glycosyltransferase SpsG
MFLNQSLLLATIERFTSRKREIICLKTISRIKILIDSSNMSKLMLDADLAIGAGGSTSWERCCLSVTAFIFLIDENQRMIVQQLVKFGSVKLIENIKSIKINLDDIQNDMSLWASMIRKSKNICDGLGTERARNYVI